MSAALATAPSIMVPAPEHFGEVEVDVVTALQWAKDNAIVPTGPDGRVTAGDINAARLQHKLPRYKIVKRTLNGVAAEIGPAPRDITARVPARPAAAARDPASPIAASEYELINLVTTHSGTITGLVTPQIAGWILVLNTGNRPLAKRSVERFVAILRDGHWVNTGEPIIISSTGCLNDGQHRLTAVVRSGLPAIMDLRFGIAREAFAATGTGARRTAGNVLAIAGKANASMQAAIARLLVHYRANQMHKSTQQVEGHAVIEIANTEPEIGEVAALIRSLKFAPARTAPFGFALVLASKAASPAQADAFARLVDSGRADEEDASRRLHVRLRDAAIAQDRLTQVDIAVLTIRAWNAWIRGRPVQLLKITEADRTGDGFPKAVGRG